MTDNQIANEVKQRAVEVVVAIIEGGGEEKGLGKSTNNWMSMTAATECYWGMSGRGNPNAKSRIRTVAWMDYLRITKKGRTECVSVTQAGIDLYDAFLCGTLSK